MYTLADINMRVQSARDELESIKSWLEEHERELVDILVSIADAIDTLDHSLLLFSLEVE